MHFGFRHVLCIWCWHISPQKSFESNKEDDWNSANKFEKFKLTLEESVQLICIFESLSRRLAYVLKCGSSCQTRKKCDFWQCTKEQKGHKSKASFHCEITVKPCNTNKCKLILQFMLIKCWQEIIYVNFASLQ